MEDKKDLLKKMAEDDSGEKKDKKQKKSRQKPAVDKRNKSLKLISVSSAILFIAIVMVFNFVIDSFLGDKLKWDWSQTDLFSVGEVTEQLLDDLDKDVRIIGLYEEGYGSMEQYSDVEILLEKYEMKSNGRITVQYVDPVKSPAILTEIDPDEILEPKQYDFAVVCEETGKSKILGIYDLLQIGYDQSYNQTLEGVTAEEAFSGAILYVSSEDTPVVYMTRGHGEEDHEENYSVMTSLIRNNNFEIKELDMLTSSEIPEDASLLIMLAPASDINEADKKALDEYLRKGRAFMIMTEFSSSSFPVLNSLLADYNIEITDDRVREGDKDRRFNDDPYVFFADSPAGAISDQAYEKSTMVMNARALNQIKNTKEWITVENFILTGDQAYIESEGDPDSSGEAGSVPIALGSENSGFIDGSEVTEPARVLAIGSIGFVSDALLNYYGTQIYNIYGFYNSLNWLVDAKSQDLMIAAKQLPSYVLKSGSATSYWAAAITTVIVLPLGLFIAALVVYRKRKNL